MHQNSSNPSETFSLFTTLRYTTPPSGPRQCVERDHVPLFERHIARLRTAHTYFTERDGKGVWADWPGDEPVWEEIKRVLQRGEEDGGGDWRVSISAELV